MKVLRWLNAPFTISRWQYGVMTFACWFAAIILAVRLPW